jgi:hypothetical protein
MFTTVTVATRTWKPSALWQVQGQGQGQVQGQGQGQGQGLPCPATVTHPPGLVCAVVAPAGLDVMAVAVVVAGGPGVEEG